MATATVAEQSLQALPPELRPSVEHLVTEDDTPVDNLFSEKQQRLLTEPLYTSWPGPGEGRPFVVMANVALYYAVRQPPFVPDALLSLDVEVPADLWEKAHRSYFVWEYGKAPDVVVEVVSNREGGEDTSKLTGYGRAGVGYYVIFDPEQQLRQEVLRGYKRDVLEYRPLDDLSLLPGIGLGLRLWHGEFERHENSWLRWIDAQGDLIPTAAERVALEQQRAEEQQQRAEEQQQRADRLAEQLRRLGAEPEA